MRHLLLTATMVFLLGISCASAQSISHEANSTPRYELRIGYGLLSMQQIASIAEDIATIIAGLGTYSEIDHSSFGTLQVDYGWYETNNLRFGVHYNYFKIEKHYRSETSAPPKEDVVELYHTLMGTGEFHWIRGDVVHLYSGLALGASYYDRTFDSTTNNNLTKIYPAFQVTALGLRLGAKNVGIGLDIGFGSKGIVNAYVGIEF